MTNPDFSTIAAPKPSGSSSFAKLLWRIVLVVAMVGELAADLAWGYQISIGAYTPTTGDWALLFVGLFGFVLLGISLVLTKNLNAITILTGAIGSFLSAMGSYIMASILDGYFSNEIVVNHLPGYSLLQGIDWVKTYSADLQPLDMLEFVGWGIISPIGQILILPAFVLALIAAFKKPSAQSPMEMNVQQFDVNTGLPLNNTGENNMSYNNFGGFQQPSTDPNWIIMIPGYGEQPLNVFQLRQMAVVGQIKGETPLKDAKTGNVFMAKQIPGIFSQRDYVTMLLISFFLGGIGIDRFMLGQTGLGIAKLLTLGGCGVWSLIDFILIAMRKVTDSEGLPLA